jgi:hypothetical protein
MKNYSQIGQDLFVQKLIGNTGYFVEIGGYHPININNTYLLELLGWNGISLDIVDYRNEWKIRKTPLLVEDALSCDFSSIFSQYNTPELIDYLSIDVEKEGERYRSLLNCWRSNKTYKIITIEHDSHVGYSETERKPQRDFLSSEGYFLLFGDVKNQDGTSYEDWWINPIHFDMNKMNNIKSEGEIWTSILNKL